MIKYVLCVLTVGALLLGCNQPKDVDTGGVKSKEDQIKQATEKNGFDKTHESGQGQ